jgi:hypothetical protein
MSSPKDQSKLPAWWRPNRTLPRSLYEVFGNTSSTSNKVLQVVARDEIEAAKIARDQFDFTKIMSVTLKVELVWTPESL